MQLPIETWADENALPGEAKIALAESARCHKAGAYRAALLFAYVAWGLTVRARILAASCPTGVPQGKWTKLQNDLQNDDAWDSEVFDSTQTMNPAPIFDVPPDVRHQVRYWKDRRNDCAHFKQNNIVAAHVEALWSFIQSNLGRFVPNGSIGDLVARLERHFDPNLTPPGRSLDPIVRTIPSSVAPADLPKLMNEVQSRLVTKIGTVELPRIDEQAAVFDAIFGSGQGQSTKALVTHLVAQPDIFAEFVRRYPERLIFFAEHPAQIRELWRKHLTSGAQLLTIFATLLRNRLIPQNEAKEACQRVVEKLAGDIPSDGDIADLVKAGWVDALRDYAFGEPNKVNEFGWGNRNATTMQWLLMYEPISPEIAKRLCHTFESHPYPFKVCETLRRFFASDAAKRSEFAEAALQAGVSPPDTLI